MTTAAQLVTVQLGTPWAATTPRSGNEPVLHERPQRGDPVLPRDLLPLAELATGVRDRHLVDPDAAPENLGRELRLEVEPVGPKLHAVEHAAIEQLVAGLHVRERAGVQHVRDERQEA